MIALMLALQEVLASAPPPALLDIAFDLAHVAPRSALPDEILVTGRRASRRLPDLPDLEESLVPRAEMRFGANRLGIDVEPRQLLGGVVSKRILISFKRAF